MINGKMVDLLMTFQIARMSKNKRQYTSELHISPSLLIQESDSSHTRCHACLHQASAAFYPFISFLRIFKQVTLQSYWPNKEYTA